MRLAIVGLLAAAMVAAGCTTATGLQAAACHGNRNWAVGDSLTSGAGGVDGWPDQPPATGHFANLGVIGVTAAKDETWAETQVTACARGTQPTEILLAAGVNDLHEGTPLATMESNLIDFVSKVGVHLRLLSIQPLPVNGQWDAYEAQRRAYNAWMAKTFPSLYTDCSTPLQGSDGWLRPEYSLDSLAHLTDAGAQALARCVMAGE
jgi:lysophospholipase L1-like esterase